LWLADPRPQGVEAGIEEAYYGQPATITWGYAVHVAIVEVDRETDREIRKGFRMAPTGCMWSSTNMASSI
jgi:hypothetical protein